MADPTVDLMDEVWIEARVGELRNEAEARRRFSVETSPSHGEFDWGTLGALQQRPPGPPDRVATLIPAQSSTLISAANKVGKTTFILNLADSLLGGGEFLGDFKTDRVVGKVAVLNYEVSADKLVTWATEVGIDPDRLFIVNLRGCPNPLVNVEARERLAAKMRQEGVEVVIVDTFARAFTGTNQNDAGDVGAFLSDLDAFTRNEVGASELVLTVHSGWGGERSRGSSALEDWPDSIIRLTRNDAGDRFMSATGRDVHMDEDRLEYHPATRHLTLSHEGGRGAVAAQARVANLVNPVVGLVKATSGMSARALEQALREDGHTFSKGDPGKAAKRAVEAGLLDVRRKPGRGGGNLFVPLPLDAGDNP